MIILLFLAIGTIGIAAAALAVFRPRIALLALVVLDVSDINGVIQVDTGFAPFKPELVLAALAILVLVVRGHFRFAWSPVHLGLLVLFAGFCISFSNPADPATGLTVLADRGRGVLYYAIIFALALSLKGTANVVKAAVIVLGCLAAITVIQEYLLHNSTTLFGLSTVPLVQEGGALTPRHAGTDGDPNFWARLLILVTPLALSLTGIARGKVRVSIWAAVSLALVLGVYLTQSRGGFIALLVAIVLWCLIASRRSRLVLLAFPIILAAANPVLDFTGRLATLGGNTESTAFADQSVVTRARFQIDALQMFLTSPVTGHGIGSYPAIFADYDTASNFFNAVTIVPAAHNFYLEQLADGGVVLMLTWLIFFGCIIFAATRAILLFGRHGRRAERLIAVGVVASLVGWLVASIFLHLSDFRALLLVAAVGGLLDVQARALQRSQGRVAQLAVARQIWVTPLLIGLSAASLIAAPLAFVSGSSHVAVTTILAVSNQPGPVNGYSAYSLDVVSRGHIPLTFATVAAADVTVESLTHGKPTAGDSISIDQSRLGGAVQIVTTASTEAHSRQLASAASSSVTRSIAALHSGYVLSGITGPPKEVSSNFQGEGAALLVFGLAFGMWAGIRVKRRQVRHTHPQNGTLSALA